MNGHVALNDLFDTPPTGTTQPRLPGRRSVSNDRRDETPLPPEWRLKPNWRQNAKDLILFGGALFAVVSVAAGWIQGYVTKSESNHLWEAQAMVNKWNSDKAAALDAQASKLVTDVATTAVRVETMQKTTERIESKIDDRRRK